MFGEDGTPREMLPKVDTHKPILKMYQFTRVAITGVETYPKLCQFTRIAMTGVEFETFASSEHVFLRPL